MDTTSVSSSRLKVMIQEEIEDLIELRRDLHAHPELSYQETRTSEVIRRELSACEIRWEGDLAGGTGVFGHLPGKSDRAIGLRADIDALPIVEQTGLDYTSKHEGVMHACGHDGHTTMLIGAARVLGRLSREGELPHPVSFLFQPAEEGGAGAAKMIKDGCLDGRIIGPALKNVFGLHGWPGWAVGKVGTRSGPLMAAADMLEISIRGQGGHAALPHQAADPIVAGSALVSAFQSIVSRNVDPLDSAVVSICEFHGGTAHNIIPDQIRIAGTVRTFRPETQARIRRRIETLTQDICQAYGCEGDLDYQVGYPATCNDPKAVEGFEEVGRDVAGEGLVPVESPVMAAEDFSFYGQEVPSCFFFLGLIPEGQERMPGLHDHQFNFNDDAMPLGIEMFCRLALKDI